MTDTKSAQTKNVIIIQIINAFTVGILDIILPFLMQDRKIDIITIGLIYASLPIVFQLARMIFAVFSDFFGRKPFFVINGVTTAFSIAIYYFAYAPYYFLFGKITQAVGDGSNWSVNRSSVLDHAKDKDKDLIKMRAFIFIFQAIGGLISGFLIVWLFYSNTLILCALISLLVLPFAFKVLDGKRERFDSKKAIKFLDFRRKSGKFKKSLVIFCVLGVSYGLIAGYVFPLFLKANGFNIEMVGLIIGFQTLLCGLIIYFLSNRIKFEKIILYGGILYAVVLFLLGISNYILAALFMILFGITAGIVDIGSELLISKVTDKRCYSTDIGMLFMGFHAARTISLMLAGVLISIFGFIAPISISAIIFIAYFIYTYCTFREK